MTLLPEAKNHARYIAVSSTVLPKKERQVFLIQNIDSGTF